MTLRWKARAIVGAIWAGWLALNAASLFFNQTPVWPILALWAAAGLAGLALLDYLLDRLLFRRLNRLRLTAETLAPAAPAADDIAAAAAALQTWQAAQQAQQAQAAQAAHEQDLLQAAAHALGQAAAGDHPLETLLERMGDRLAECYGYAQARIILRDTPEAARLDPTAAAGRALATGAACLLDQPEAASQAAFPMRSGGQLWGVLECLSRAPQPCPPERQAALQLLADQLALVVAQARRYAQQQRLLQLESLALALTGRLQQLHDPEAILESAATELGRALGARRAVVRLQAAPPPEAAAPHDRR